MEARAGIEPANRGFAVPGLTTWLPRRSPKPLLSIDFHPFEQAKSLLPRSLHENPNTPSYSSFLRLRLRSKPTKRHHRDGRRYGLVRHRMLRQRDRNSQPRPFGQERSAIHSVLQYRTMLPHPGKSTDRNLPTSGGNRTYDERHRTAGI